MLGSASVAEFPIYLSNYVGFTPRLLSTAATLPIWKLVELNVLDFSDRTRTGISDDDLEIIAPFFCFATLVLQAKMRFQVI